MNAAKEIDILIVGGGIVGAALCCALAGLPTGHGSLRVGLLEARRPSEGQSGPRDVRVSAITLASQRLLEALEVWDSVVARSGVGCFREMHVWDTAGSGEIHFDSADIGEETLGYIVENNAIVAALWERLRRLESVGLFTPEQPVALQRSDGLMEVVTASGRAWGCALVVGADGFDSAVRSLAGIETSGWMYDQMAIVATVRPERYHADTAWQRFLPNGPLAFLPLTGGCCSIVWSTTPEQAADLLALSREGFADALTAAFERRLGRIELLGSRQAYPLRLLHAREYVRPGVALVGDAAHTVHPLAGQGVNLGLLDAAVLVDVLSDAFAAGRPLGSLATLRRYERWRRGENLLMLAVVDGLKRLFASPLAPVRVVRGLGLNLTNAAAPLKHFLMRRAMGLTGDLPRLVRPTV